MSGVSEGIWYNTWIGSPVLQISTQIDNAWALLKVRLRERQQDLSKHFNTEEAFIQAAQEEWEKLDWAAVDKSIDSMNKRVQVLKKHGGHTKF
jgi:hypothetical protein